MARECGCSDVIHWSDESKFLNQFVLKGGDIPGCMLNVVLLFLTESRQQQCQSYH